MFSLLTAVELRVLVLGAVLTPVEFLPVELTLEALRELLVVEVLPTEAEVLELVPELTLVVAASDVFTLELPTLTPLFVPA